MEADIIRYSQKWRGNVTPVVKFILIRRTENARRETVFMGEVGRRYKISFRSLNYFANGSLVNVTARKSKKKKKKGEKKTEKKERKKWEDLRLIQSAYVSHVNFNRTLRGLKRKRTSSSELR